MKEFKQWLRTHPFKAMAFEAVFVAIAVAVAFRDDWFKWGCIIYGALVLLWAIVAWLDMKKLTALMLAGLLGVPIASGQEKPREGIVGIGVGIVVICGGGYCIYRLVKFCQKKFPKEPAPNTNDPPAELLGFAAAGTGIGGYGASKNNGELGSCFPGDVEFALSDEPQDEPTTFILDCFVAPGPRLRQSVSFRKGPDTYQPWPDFQAEVAAAGLHVSGHADGTEYFAKDGIPCAPSEVPLSFAQDGTVVHLAGGTPRTVVVSRSTNLVDWVPLMRTTAGEGTGFRVIDTSIHQTMFFRAELVQAQRN